MKWPPVAGRPRTNAARTMKTSPPYFARTVTLLTIAASETPRMLKKRREGDRERREPAHGPEVRGILRVDPDHPEEILGEHDRDRPERSGADHGELSPSEEEARESAPAVAAEDVHASGLRQSARDLGERQRAADREEPARRPNAEHGKRSGELRSDARRRAEDPGADRRADDDGDGAPEAERPPQLVRRSLRRDSVRHPAMLRHALAHAAGKPRERARAPRRPGRGAEENLGGHRIYCP